MRKVNNKLISELVVAARSILNQDGGEDEVQDLWEIETLTKSFEKILYRKPIH